MSCEVLQCRYADTHVTKGHRCGICHRYGHGQIECRNSVLKNNLQQHLNTHLPINMQCTVDYCAYKAFHTTRGHYCNVCHVFYDKCKCNATQFKCPFCRADVNFFDRDRCKLHGLTEKCAICLTNSIDTRLPCGHVLCVKCIEQIIAGSEPEPEYGVPGPTDHNMTISRSTLQNHDNAYTIVYVGQGCNYYIRKKNGVFGWFFMHCDDWGQYGVNRTPQLNAWREGLNRVDLVGVPEF